jgi:alpha-ketoglutarate-dependent taurine dioxygenase
MVSAQALRRALTTAADEGWALLDGVLRDCVHLAKADGFDVVPTRARDAPIGVLRPVSATAAHPASLSAIVGLGQMPLHTDGAHLRQPPDFTLLEAAHAVAGEDTLLYRTRDCDWDEDARHGMFAVVGSGAAFVSTAVDGERVRIDPGCMRPRDRMAERTLSRLSARTGDCVIHRWCTSPDTVLVIDNRRTLHGRTTVRSNSTRVLHRLMLRVAS